MEIKRLCLLKFLCSVLFLSIIFPSHHNISKTFFPFISLSICWAQENVSEMSPGASLCKNAQKRLDNAIETCDQVILQEISDLYEETGWDCLYKLLREKNKEYFSKCFQLEEYIAECKFDKILSAAKFIDDNQNLLYSKRILHEELLNAKCNEFYGKCIKAEIEEAYNGQNIDNIAKIEKIFDYTFKAFDNCTNYKNIVMFVRKIKNDYYHAYISESLDKCLVNGDFVSLMNNKKFINNYMENCSDFPEMNKKLERIMCFFYKRWYEKIHEKTVTDCDFDLYDQVVYFGSSKELGYCANVDYALESTDMSHNREMDLNTQCKVLLKCGHEQVRSIVQSCDLKQIEELYKIITSCEDSEEKQQSVKKQVCSSLADCFDNDLKSAANNCDYQKLETIEKSMNLFDEYECDVKGEMDDSLSSTKEKFVSNCFQRNLEISTSLCDFGRIVRMERFLKSPFWKPLFKKIKDKLEKAKMALAERCLENELKNLVLSCDYPTLYKVEKYVQEGLSISPEGINVHALLEKTKLEFSETCLENKVENAFESCQVKLFFKWEYILKKAFADVPQTQEYLNKLQTQKRMIFDHCFKPRIIKAQHDLDISRINYLNVAVEKYLKDLPDIESYRFLIKQAKDYCLRGGNK